MEFHHRDRTIKVTKRGNFHLVDASGEQDGPMYDTLAEAEARVDRTASNKRKYLDLPVLLVERPSYGGELRVVRATLRGYSATSGDATMAVGGKQYKTRASVDIYPADKRALVLIEAAIAAMAASKVADSNLQAWKLQSRTQGYGQPSPEQIDSARQGVVKRFETMERQPLDDEEGRA